MSPTLTRDDLLTRFDVRTTLRQVDLPPDSGLSAGHVFIRLLTGAGADAFGHASLKTPELARATLFAACVCDGAGAPLFTIKDAPRIAELPNRVLSPVVDAIIDHNHLREEATNAAVPTSASGQPSCSGSASPATSDAPLAS
ncbi:hypothetical protein LBMAG53_38910 [Planctomycetota bacterium]|nr:hypothetical protein LBMAG53_38910 [Planctomycetota bacterium]